MSDLADRIAQRLDDILDHMEAGRFSSSEASRGLAYGGPDGADIVLTVYDVARIAAEVAESC